MTLTPVAEKRAEEAREAASAVDGRPRFSQLSDIEVRAKDDGGFTFAGTAAVFDQLSDDLGGFREMIKRGAFKPVLEDDVRFLFNHNPDHVMARTAAGTLSLEEKPRGLATDADVSDISIARDVQIMLKRGDISQMSFGFRVAEDSWFEDDEGNLIRTIHKFEELFDVSVVTFPAYPQTDAAVRALDKLRRGVLPTAEERSAIEDLVTPHSTQQDPEEHDDQAAGAELVDKAEGTDAGADVESPETPDGLSARSARLRVRELIART